jgi:hypothetical protein
MAWYLHAVLLLLIWFAYQYGCHRQSLSNLSTAKSPRPDRKRRDFIKAYCEIMSMPLFLLSFIWADVKQR